MRFSKGEGTPMGSLRGHSSWTCLVTYSHQQQGHCSEMSTVQGLEQRHCGISEHVHTAKQRSRKLHMALDLHYKYDVR